MYYMYSPRSTSRSHGCLIWETSAMWAPLATPQRAAPDDGAPHSDACAKSEALEEQETAEVDKRVEMRGEPDLSVVDLSCAGLLAGVSADFWRGRLTAVLGPSGAGKTTFFSILSGRLRPTSGLVALRGVPTSLPDHPGLLGYATEDEPLSPLLTVEESLRVAAAVKLPAAVDRRERDRLLRRLLSLLRLEHVRHARVGEGAAFGAARGVSFGERRRLSIGVELVTMPEILLVDDATCGLDSRTAHEVMDTLSSVARSGFAVLTIVHQPSCRIFSVIDDVLCLAPGGRTLFTGGAACAIDHFARCGMPCAPTRPPVEHLLTILSGRLGPHTPRADGEAMWAASASASASESAAAFAAAAAAAESEAGWEATRGLAGDVEGADVPCEDACHHSANQAAIGAANIANLHERWSRRNARLASPRPAAAALEGAAAGGQHNARRRRRRDRPSFARQLRSYTWAACTQARRRWPKMLLDFALMGLLGVAAGIPHKDGDFVGPLPAELRKHCRAFWSLGTHTTPAAVAAACDDNVGDGALVGAQYLVATLGLLSFAVTNGVWGANLAHVHADQMPRAQALALFIGADLASLPWMLLSPPLLLGAYHSLVPLVVTWSTWYVTVVLVLWANAPIGCALTLRLGYYLAFPAGVVFAFTMFIFDGVSLPLSSWGALSWLPSLCINRWAIESLYLAVVRNYAHKYNLTAPLARLDYHFGTQARRNAAIIGLGLCWRVVAFACLRRKPRKPSSDA